MVVKGRLCDWSMEGCFVGHKSSKENKVELTIFSCMGQSVIFSTNICKLRAAMIYSFAHRDSGSLKALTWHSFISHFVRMASYVVNSFATSAQ